MSNGARHALGAVAGLIMTPLLLAILSYGLSDLLVTYQRALSVGWLGVGVVVASAVLFALLMGSRMSPLASLITGLAYTLVGAAVPLAQTLRMNPRLLVPDALPRELTVGYTTLLYSGLLLFLGVALLVASMFPSRWRSARPAAVPQQQYYTPAEPYRQPDAFQQQPDPFQPAPEPYRPQPEPYQPPQQYPPQAQSQPGQSQHGQPQYGHPQQSQPQQVKPTQHLPTFPAQPPEGPEDSTRPMNRD